jgi:hypothetical protein
LSSGLEELAHELLKPEHVVEVLHLAGVRLPL